MVYRTSGFSWGDEKKMTVCERQSYDDFCKLEQIYGADRANREAAETFVEAVDGQQEVAINLVDEEDSDAPIEIGEDESVNKSDHQTPSFAKRIKKEKDKEKGKRKRPEVVNMTSSLNNISSNFSSFMVDMNSHLGSIATAFTSITQYEQALLTREQAVMDHEQEKENQLNGLLNEVIRIPGLTNVETMLCAEKLASTPSKLTLFYQYPNDEWKKEFLLNLIHPSMSHRDG